MTDPILPSPSTVRDIYDSEPLTEAGMSRGKKTADHTSRGPGFLHSSNNVFVHSLLKKSAFLCPSKRPLAPKKFEGVSDASSCLKKLSDYKKDPLCRSIFVGIMWEVA